MKKIRLLLIAALFTGTAAGQGYDIKVEFKGATDSMFYLVRYLFDQLYIADTAVVKGGKARFTGKQELERGVYTLVSQEKSVYFDFFVNDTQKFTLITDKADVVKNLKVVGSKDNELFFSYIKYITAKNQDFNEVREKTKGKNKADSTRIINEKIQQLNTDVKNFEADFMQKSKGTFVYDVMNLKTEKEPKEIPKASNGRPDSLYQYYYYKSHFWDGVNFKDERIIRTPFFDDRVKKYFDQVILQHPDTVIQEIDKILAKCDEGNQIYNLLLGHFTYKAEQSKIMGFDKVFVHLADKYIIPGKAKKVYDEETVTKIKERVDIVRNLLLEARAPELYLIDTTDGGKVRKMGFDTATSSKSITDLYYKNIEKLTPLFKTLSQVKSKYVVLVFWAADCGHCQTEIPKLHEELKKLKGKIDYKVVAVQTKDELYDSWKKFIIEKKLTDFLHYFDPIHLNNLKVNYDIYSTPVIYVLDKDKKIKAKRLAAEQVPNMLESLESIEKMELDRAKNK
jgi:thiol-disulfide isomerase/thioredoxin